METLPLYTIKKNPSNVQGTKVKSSTDAYGIARQLFEDDIDVYESFWVILFNQGMESIGIAKIGQGGITATSVDLRLIAKYAIETLATGCILVHNHPSGRLVPSQEDIELTKKITQALGLLDVKVRDHLIVTKNSYYSFLDDGLL
jgi:DNA repair protein RadC